jgi:hypothetical protein
MAGDRGHLRAMRLLPFAAAALLRPIVVDLTLKRQGKSSCADSSQI